MSRSASLIARATAPLAFADDRVNAASDWMRRRTPWAWWPAQPPSPRRPIGAEHHAAYALQSVGITALVEGLACATGNLPSGRRLWRDRGIQLIATVAAAAITTGAWDRRADRRRLRWR
jgi:hypothetical protein